MKQFFDYLPVIVFFGLYFAGGRDIMLATWGIIAACTLQVTLSWAIWRRVERMHLTVFVITLIFGGLTLLFRDEIFIKWRPSIISFVLAGVLVLGQFLRERNLLQRLCEALMRNGLGFVIGLTRRDWTVLNVAFVVYFLVIGGLNLWVAYTFTTDFWVNFKLFGLTAIQFLFYIAAFAFVYKRMSPADRARVTGKEVPESSEEDDDAVRDHQ
jgi:intracellular septation protein